MTGKLPITCSKCFELLTWRKVDFTRADTYADWCLEVTCRCGLWVERDYPWLYDYAREAYNEALGVELETQRRNILDAALGRSGNLYLETLIQALPASNGEDGQG